jgi:hypothetical protein
MPAELAICLNARLSPADRERRYEHPLHAILAARAPGSQVSGGAFLSPAGEPLSAQIEIDLHGDPAAGTAAAIRALESLGAPKGSTARINDGTPIPFGFTEGLALYLNGPARRGIRLPAATRTSSSNGSSAGSATTVTCSRIGKARGRRRCTGMASRPPRCAIS